MASNYPRKKQRYCGFDITLERDGRWDVREPNGDVFASNFIALSEAMFWIDREWPEGAPK